MNTAGGVSARSSDHSRANSRSSSVKNLADWISAGRKSVEIRAMITVAIPSKINIHLHPARPPIPSIFIIAVESKPKRWKC